MNFLLLLITFFLAVILEITVIKIPLSLILLLVLFVRNKTPVIFFLALIVGAILDLSRVQVIGLTSIYFLIVIFLVFLYDKKYEIDTLSFIVISSVIISAINAFIYDMPVLTHVFLSLILGIFLYKNIFFLGGGTKAVSQKKPLRF